MIDALKRDVESLSQQFDAELDQAKSTEACEGLRVKYLGRSGLVAPMLQRLQDVPKEDKAEAGKLLNGLKGGL